MPDPKKANESLSSISHDLKSPLTGIRMMSHLLLEKKVGPLNEKQEQMLQSIVSNSDQLLNAVNKHFSSSHIEP
ncbi:histidine kinase dimerization/phospho-acceptor domain-containing protein [Rubritalea spongiae]|uniref:histidine kinase n=1 Tax=Rubritalea spongiae TaxID=430797 RepID=A0ABW5DY02_9BACT